MQRSVVPEAAGLPVGVTVAGANRHDHLLLAESLAGLIVRRRPQGLRLDKGYD